MGKSTISTAIFHSVLYVYHMNHHFSWENHHFEWENHHFLYVYQRVPILAQVLTHGTLLTAGVPTMMSPS